MPQIDVRACDVKIGDEMFHNMNNEMPPAYWWWRVTSVKRINDNTVEIGVGSFSGWYTRKHILECVTVRRDGAGQQ